MSIELAKMNVTGGNQHEERYLAIALVPCAWSCAAITASAETVLEKIKKDGVLVVGTEATYGPYEFLDDDSNPIGCDIWLAQQIADELGVELKIQDMSFDGIIPAVQSGSVDIGIAAFTVDEERAKVIDFSNQYELSEQLLIVKKGDARRLHHQGIPGRARRSARRWAPCSPR